jgi:hypothetical protein
LQSVLFNLTRQEDGLQIRPTTHSHRLCHEKKLMSLTLPNVLFCLLAAVTGLSAIAVVVTQNVVRAATWLLFALAGAAGIFFLLGADFIGATQLLIYVGGTLVLVVFGVMLTAQGPFINM